MNEGEPKFAPALCLVNHVSIATGDMYSILETLCELMLCCPDFVDVS